MISEPATVQQEDDLEVVTHVDVSHLVTEDDTPVDNLFSELQMRMLPHILNTSWKPGVPFIALANVGLYFAVNGKPLVPDTLVSIGVERPPEMHRKEHRAYFTWMYGKGPDIVIEIVSNREGGEADRKMRAYAFHGVPFYVIYDPLERIQRPALQCFQLTRSDTEVAYRPLAQVMFPGTGLGIVEWEGEFEGGQSRWIRWVDASGKLLPTGGELARAAQANAEAAQANAEAARADAEAAEARAEAMAKRLREAGIDPDAVG